MKRILVNAEQPNEFRVAFCEEGKLVDFEQESAHHNPATGNIYIGVVTAVRSELESAFVEFGEERHGLLPFNRLGGPGPRSSTPQFNDTSTPSQSVDLKVDQRILVQVFREARGEKGAALTREFSLPGRFIVLKPNTDIRTVTRRVSDEHRSRLRTLGNRLPHVDNVGWIIRTTAVDHDFEEIVGDFHRLLNLWRKIESEFDKSTHQVPTLVYSDNKLIQRIMRDRFRNDGTQLMVDDPVVYREARDFASELMPELRDQIQLYKGDRPIFERHRVERDVVNLFSRRVELPSGGEVVFDPTEALLSIDVNSARNTSRDNLEETALHTNLEAAEEICRQIKLRNVGGLIVVDFIDMPYEEHNRKVEAVVQECLAKDPTNSESSPITQFGLMELSRQRRGLSIYDTHFQICEHCQGAGLVQRLEGNANRVLRQLSYVAHNPRKQENQFICRVPEEVASYILNRERKYLRDLEKNTRKQIIIFGDPEFHDSGFVIEEKRVRSLDFESGTNLEDVVTDAHRDIRTRAKPQVEEEDRNAVPLISPQATPQRKKKQREAPQTDQRSKSNKKKSGSGKKQPQPKQGAIGRFFSSIFGGADQKSKKTSGKKGAKGQPKRADAANKRTSTQGQGRRPQQETRGTDSDRRNTRNQRGSARRAPQAQRTGDAQREDRPSTRRAGTPRPGRPRRRPADSTDSQSSQGRGRSDASQRSGDHRTVRDASAPDRRAPRNQRSANPRTERVDSRQRNPQGQPDSGTPSRANQPQGRRPRNPRQDQPSSGERQAAPSSSARAPVSNRRMPQAQREASESRPESSRERPQQERGAVDQAPSSQSTEGQGSSTSEKVTVNTRRPPQQAARQASQNVEVVSKKPSTPRPADNTPSTSPEKQEQSRQEPNKVEQAAREAGQPAKPQQEREEKPAAALAPSTPSPSSTNENPESSGGARAGNDPRQRAS